MEIDESQGSVSGKGLVGQFRPLRLPPTATVPSFLLVGEQKAALQEELLYNRNRPPAFQKC